jgi:hypothetical protein
MKLHEITVQVMWDADVNRWVASSEMVSGLHVEAADMESLLEVIDDVLPDLLLNKTAQDDLPIGGIPYHIMHERLAQMHG